MGRIRKDNKFDTLSAKSGSLDDFEITSAATLRMFVQTAKEKFMHTNGGEYAFLEILKTFLDRIKKQKDLFKQHRESESIKYLIELDNILREAKADMNQAIQYKYHPIKLFNNSKGVDIQFKEFVIRYVVKHYSKDILALNSEDILTSYSQLPGNNTRLTDLQKKNRLDFISIVQGAFEIEQKSLHQAAKGRMSFDDLCRALLPVVNKLGNIEWTRRLDRDTWSKESKNSVKPEDSLFIKKVNKRNDH